MSDNEIRRTLADSVRRNLTENILPYWMNTMVDPAGGFYGRRDGYDRLHADAHKGAVLAGRLLWSFSAAYRVLGDPAYRVMADRALDALIDRFYDHEYGGVYWSVSADGSPADTHKQFYALGFAIYGLAEYVAAVGTGDERGRRALDYAVKLFGDIEAHSRDCVDGGYIEATARDWSPIADMRLSAKDMNVAKSMNTHLHIIEPYTRLFAVWPDESLAEAIRSLLAVFMQRIEDSATHHLGLFFDHRWRRSDATVSYGHDIEASWLLLESALALGDHELVEVVRGHCASIAMAALEGLQPDGSMIYECHRDGALDLERHWWVQAELLVGQLYLWKYHGRADMLGQAWNTWCYIDSHIVDHVAGEWFWSCDGVTGAACRDNDKAGFWKCPYHNTRMCLEALAVLRL
ncbi:MAG: AGE family epimerase/isomerase [Muribaculaceae bacterium]|nr:AGE family epimerase/isomerase [Muribaculaceae bacterium]